MVPNPPLAFTDIDPRMDTPVGRAQLKALRYAGFDAALATSGGRPGTILASAPINANEVVPVPWNEYACKAACQVVAIRNLAERNHDFANAARNPAGLSRGSLDETRLLWRRHYFTEQETEWLLNYGFPTLPLNAVVVKAAPRTPSKKKAFAKRTAEEKAARRARDATALAVRGAKVGKAKKKAQKKHAQAKKKYKNALKSLGTVAVLPGDVITFSIIDARDTAALLKRAITHVDQRVAGMRIRDGKDVEVERDNIIIISYQTAPNAYPEMSLYDLLIYHNNSPTFVRGPGGALASRQLRTVQPVKNFLKELFVYFPTVSTLLDEVKMAMKDSFSMLRCMRVNAQCSRVRVIFWLVSEEAKQLKTLLARPLFEINNNNPVMYVNDASALAKSLMSFIMQKPLTEDPPEYGQYGYDVYSIASGNDPGTKTCITGPNGLISTAKAVKNNALSLPAPRLHRCAMNPSARSILQKLFGTRSATPLPDSVAVKVFQQHEKIVTPTSITGSFASLRWTQHNTAKPGVITPRAWRDKVFTWELPHARVPRAVAVELNNRAHPAAAWTDVAARSSPLTVYYGEQATEIRSVSGAALLATFLALAPGNSFLNGLSGEAELRAPLSDAQTRAPVLLSEMIQRLREARRLPTYNNPRSLLEIVARNPYPKVEEHSTSLMSQIWFPSADNGPVTLYPNLVANAIKEGGDHCQADAARALGLVMVTADRAAGAGAILAGASVVTIRRVPSTAPPILGGEYAGESYMVPRAEPAPAAGAGSGVMTWAQALTNIKNGEGGRWTSLTATSAKGRSGLTGAQRHASAAIRAVINFPGIPAAGLRGPTGWNKFKRLIRKGVDKTNIAKALWKGAKNLAVGPANRLWGLVKTATAHMKPGGPVRPLSWLGAGDRKQATVCASPQLAAAARGEARRGLAPSAEQQGHIGETEYEHYRPGAVRDDEGVDPTSDWGRAIAREVRGVRGLGSLPVQGGGGPLPVWRLEPNPRGGMRLVDDVKSIPGISTTTWGLLSNYITTMDVFSADFQPGEYTRQLLMHHPQWVDIFRLGLRVEVVRELPVMSAARLAAAHRSLPPGARWLAPEKNEVILLDTKSIKVGGHTFLHGTVLSDAQGPFPNVILPNDYFAQGGTRSGWFVKPDQGVAEAVPAFKHIPEYLGNYIDGFSPCVAVFCGLLRNADDQLKFARERFAEKIRVGDLPDPAALAQAKQNYLTIFQTYQETFGEWQHGHFVLYETARFQRERNHQLVKMARHILGSVEPEDWVRRHRRRSLRQIFLDRNSTNQKLANAWLFTCAFFAIVHCCHHGRRCVLIGGNYGGYIEGVTELTLRRVDGAAVIGGEPQTFQQAWKYFYQTTPRNVSDRLADPWVAGYLTRSRCARNALETFVRLAQGNYYRHMRLFVRAHEVVTRAALQIGNYPLPYKSVPVGVARAKWPSRGVRALPPTLHTSAIHEQHRQPRSGGVNYQRRRPGARVQDLFSDSAFSPPNKNLYEFIITQAVSKEPLYPGVAFRPGGASFATFSDAVLPPNPLDRFGQLKLSQRLSEFFTGRFVQLCSAVGTVLNAIINQAGVVLQSEFFPPLNLLTFCAPTPRKIFAMGAAVDAFEGLYVQDIAPSAVGIAAAVEARQPTGDDPRSVRESLSARDAFSYEENRWRHYTAAGEDAPPSARADFPARIRWTPQPKALLYQESQAKYFGARYAAAEEQAARVWGIALTEGGEEEAHVVRERWARARGTAAADGSLYILLANAILGLLHAQRRRGELTMMWKCVISAAHALHERKQRWYAHGLRVDDARPPLDVIDYSVEMDILSTFSSPQDVFAYVAQLSNQVGVDTRYPPHDMGNTTTRLIGSPNLTIQSDLEGINLATRREIARKTLEQEYNLWADAKNATLAAQQSLTERDKFPQLLYPHIQISTPGAVNAQVEMVPPRHVPTQLRLFVPSTLATVLNEEANQEAVVASYLMGRMARAKIRMKGENPADGREHYQREFAALRTALTVFADRRPVFNEVLWSAWQHARLPQHAAPRAAAAGRVAAAARRPTAAEWAPMDASVADEGSRPRPGAAAAARGFEPAAAESVPMDESAATRTTAPPPATALPARPRQDVVLLRHTERGQRLVVATRENLERARLALALARASPAPTLPPRRRNLAKRKAAPGAKVAHTALETAAHRSAGLGAALPAPVSQVDALLRGGPGRQLHFLESPPPVAARAAVSVTPRPTVVSPRLVAARAAVSVTPRPTVLIPPVTPPREQRGRQRTASRRKRPRSPSQRSDHGRGSATRPVPRPRKVRKRSRASTRKKRATAVQRRGLERFWRGQKAGRGADE